MEQYNLLVIYNIHVHVCNRRMGINSINIDRALIRINYLDTYLEVHEVFVCNIAIFIRALFRVINTNPIMKIFGQHSNKHTTDE